jgi:hypothetical protein
MLHGLLATTRHKEWGEKNGNIKRYYGLILFSGNRKKGVKPEKESLRDLPHSQVRRFYSSDEAEPQERKDKKRKHEQKVIAQVS